MLTFFSQFSQRVSDVTTELTKASHSQPRHPGPSPGPR